MQQTKTNFVLYIEPQTLLNRVYYDSFLRRHAAEATAFIGAKDISVMFERNDGTKPTIEAMDYGTLATLLRSARNPKGAEIYKDARITQWTMQPKEMVGYQTFIEVNNIANIHSLSNFFREFGFLGIANAPPSVLTYVIEGNTYKAIYLPPIVENLPSERFVKALAASEARLERSEELEIRHVDGTHKSTLREFVDDAKRMLGNPVKGGVSTVMDGTHRSTSASIVGAELNSIYIEGSTKIAPSIPIRLRNVIFAKEKPPNRQDRFLGLDEDGWTALKEIGVDG